MLKEAHHHALASHMLWALWATVQAAICDIEFGYLVGIHFMQYLCHSMFFSKSVGQLLIVRIHYCFHVIDNFPKELSYFTYIVTESRFIRAWKLDDF